MITNWKVSNFKSIREETELSLKPLTIFAGANSSGKSTFIQSLLLIAQTLAHKVSSRSVVLNGALTSLGQFDDLKSNGSELDQITIKCTCEPSEQTDAVRSRAEFRPGFNPYYDYQYNQLREVSFEISFDADPSSSQRELFQIQPRLFATQLSCMSRDEDNLDQVSNILLRRSENSNSETGIDDVVNVMDDALRTSMDYEVALDEGSMDEIKEEYISARPVGCMLKHFLPERIVYTIDRMQEDAKKITSALQENRPSTFGRRYGLTLHLILTDEIKAVLRDVLQDTVNLDEIIDGKYEKSSFSVSEPNPEAITIHDWPERLRAVALEDQMQVQQKLRECEDLFDRIYQAMRNSNVIIPTSQFNLPKQPPREIARASGYLDNFFSSCFKYLGPLRDAPKPLYPLAPAADPYDVGLRGEHTASILELHKNKKIKYLPSDNFKLPAIDRSMITRSLETAVVDWLQYLGVAGSVESRDRGKLGHELKVAIPNSGSSHDLTHVGVGVSQVLPILVMCLLADTDSTLVFEQPELHLHPKVQTLLGDFFLSMALCNKQCIVETHSEYFIDRLRFRIAAAPPENELNSQAKIYFVEKPAQESLFREVEINEYGAITDWPEGFFDQSQQQAEDILRAATAKRKANRGEKGA